MPNEHQLTAMPSRHTASDMTTTESMKKPRHSVAIRLEVLQKLESGKFTQRELQKEYTIGSKPTFQRWRQQKAVFQKMVADGQGHLTSVITYKDLNDDGKRSRANSTNESLDEQREKKRSAVGSKEGDGGTVAVKQEDPAETQSGIINSWSTNDDMQVAAKSKEEAMKDLERWLLHEVFGGMAPWNHIIKEYAKKFFEQGLHSKIMVQELCNESDIKRFTWIPEMHKRAFLANAGLKKE